MSLFTELRRRNVYRVAALYIIVSWLVLQVADVFMSFLPLPEWTPNLVFVLLVLGFPVALVLAWAFELTPDGLRRERQAVASRAQPGGFRKVDGVILLALVAIAAYAVATRERGGAPAGPATTAGAPEAIDSIVVLPLEDLTNDPGQAYFVAGMHEALITELSKVQALRVISRTSAMAYQDSDKPVPQIARELGVDAVVEGSVLRAGDTVRITAQLIEAGTDRHLWADNFDRKLTDILSLYGEVAQSIVAQIRVKVTPVEASRLRTEREVLPQVYENYLQGRYLCDNWSPQEMAQGVERMREAVRLDPAWAPAQAELALCLQYQAFFNFVMPGDIHAESLAAAERALQLDEKLAEAHVAMAGIDYYLEYDRDAAERQLRRALELNPGSVRALIHLSWLFGESGRFEEALPPTLKALEHDPLSTVATHALGQVYFLARKFDHALTAFAEAVDLDPGDPLLQFSMALVEGERGNLERALELDRTALELAPQASLFLGTYGYHLALAGDTAQARSVLERLYSAATPAPYDTAMVHLGLGEYDEAIEQLEAAYAQRNSQLIYLPAGPWFDPLRDRPRFRALMERIGW
ncbi:MAG: tetratricopeptide repeat protein [Xanthomonadales bacterium]|nr:tetratricopeptide repeat protein [Xanthomonadales bacterium]NIN58813.1 tetratricopeptide repeat protein [Xanthomonadales bacterium]NIN74081.1 tetratricopeptide repeat protein [Xanthomonadales bacterium]NIO14614.1 tetratricopeptide repeat protein [Xanthomonadales bacterium]NIP11206.1 tetratricopeptide repeat protein [Xanthomonadales bacterium]